MSVDISSLNREQKEAVTYMQGPLLVLAGAGSGKTRVLTYKIAYMLEKGYVSPWNILAITFTNKAANEMKSRINNLLGERTSGMWVCTFHSMCVRILQLYADKIGLKNNWNIYDDKDQKKLIKIVMADLKIDLKAYSEKMVLSKISKWKNKLITPEESQKIVFDPSSEVASEVYFEYQKRLKKLNAFDFDDLLFYTYFLFKDNYEILEIYQKRFQYVLVDEYQDTNKAQYEIVKMLAEKSQNIMVVGDDDQSIYSWRGADINNILNFERDFKQAKTVKLEQNYRSTQNILNAANSIIQNNVNRKGKVLYSKENVGDKIDIYHASNEKDEGRWIASEIEKLKNKGIYYRDVAVFFRTNAQSRVIEDSFIKACVPYKIVGGLKFFERAEVKDMIAYMSILLNSDDDVSCERVINVPRRGIGRTTINYIHKIANKYNCSFYEALGHVAEDDNIRPFTKNSIKSFIKCIETQKNIENQYKFNTRAITKNQDSLKDRMQRFFDSTGVIDDLRSQKTGEAESRIENINELLGVIDEFVKTHNSKEVFFNRAEENNNSDRYENEEFSGEKLKDLLSWLRLRTDMDTLGTVSKNDDKDDPEKKNQDLSTNSVTLMTVHSAKGLEFDYVFITGMEEGIFPHFSSFSDLGELEEERRLAYVAVTRAKKSLVLTCAQARQFQGKSQYNPASRFINEIPNEYKITTGCGSDGYEGFGWDKRGDRHGIAGIGKVENKVKWKYNGEFRPGRQNLHKKRDNVLSKDSFFNNNKESTMSNREEATYKIGDKISHKVFGIGVVVKVESDTIEVKFERNNKTRKMMPEFAPIQKI